MVILTWIRGFNPHRHKYINLYGFVQAVMFIYILWHYKYDVFLKSHQLQFCIYRVGDQILQVNDHTLRNVNLPEAHSIFSRVEAGPVRLIVVKSKPTQTVSELHAKWLMSLIKRK